MELIGHQVLPCHHRRCLICEDFCSMIPLGFLQEKLILTHGLLRNVSWRNPLANLLKRKQVVSTFDVGGKT